MIPVGCMCPSARHATLGGRWALCSGAFLFSSRRRHTRCPSAWSSDVCSSDLSHFVEQGGVPGEFDLVILLEAPLDLGEFENDDLFEGLVADGVIGNQEIGRESR